MNKRRFFVLAADGADPRLLEGYMADGTCPTLARLSRQGFCCPLETTLPPVSPVAWTSFLTGCGPGEHGIVDFVAREPDLYRLTLGLYRTIAGDPLRYETKRLVPGLPSLLQESGVPGYFLWLPGTFPPETTYGGSLAGLGVPDAQGTFGTSALYSTEPDAGRGGQVRDRRLVTLLKRTVTGYSAPVLPGPFDGPVLSLSREGGRLNLWLHRAGEGPAGEAVPLATLEPGGWTGWLRFRLGSGGRTTEAMARFKWLAAEQPLELYRTAVQYVPGGAPFDLASPPGFDRQVEGWVGTYPTLGLACDLNGLQLGLVDEETFLEDAWRTWNQRAEALLYLAGRDDWRLAVGHLFTLDATQHLFWEGRGTETLQPGGWVQEAYGWLDQLVARLQESLGSETTLLVVSDHGVCPLRKRVALNRWLLQHGYLSVRPGPAGKPLIDWERTQAASLGHGGIFLNVVGREPRGTVEPGKAYEALRDRLAQELRSWQDPDTGSPVVDQVWRREEVYRGASLHRLPDLPLALHPGYGLDRRDMMGQVSADGPVLADVTGRWRAGHEGPYRPDAVPGVLLAAGPGVSPHAPEDAAMVDLAPTLLTALGLPVPDCMTGQALVQLLS